MKENTPPTNGTSKLKQSFDTIQQFFMINTQQPSREGRKTNTTQRMCDDSPASYSMVNDCRFSYMVINRTRKLLRPFSFNIIVGNPVRASLFRPFSFNVIAETLV